MEVKSICEYWPLTHRRSFNLGSKYLDSVSLLYCTRIKQTLFSHKHKFSHIIFICNNQFFFQKEFARDITHHWYYLHAKIIAYFILFKLLLFGLWLVTRMMYDPSILVDRKCNRETDRNRWVTSVRSSCTGWLPKMFSGMWTWLNIRNIYYSLLHNGKEGG